jgi:hypothetical protein
MVQGLPWWQAVFVLVPWALVPTAGSQFGGKFGGGFIGAILAGGIGGGIGGGAAMACSKLARRRGNAGLKILSMACVSVIAYGGFLSVADMVSRALPPAPVSLTAPPPVIPSQPPVTLSMPASCPQTEPASPGAASVSDDVFDFSSAPGNEIDGGHTIQWTGPAVTVSGTASGVRASAEGWTVELDPARGATLGCATYPDATESRVGTAPYMSLSGGGTDCGSARGTFTIYQIGFTRQGAVGLLNAVFSERCTPTSPPLVGYVRFGATAPTPFPGLPSTAEPITAPAHVVATSANADEFYANSAQGDAVGQGQQTDLTGSSVLVTGSLDKVDIRAAGWTMDLAPKTGEHLGPGTYIGAIRMGSATAPEISVRGTSTSCDRDYGTFTIYQISVDGNGAVTALNATFSQSCETPSMPPLVGYVRFHATAPTPVPTLPYMGGATTPPATSGTASKNADEFWVESAPGDVIGLGQKVDLTGQAVHVEGSLGTVQVNLGQWFLLLMASNGKQLAPGTYVLGTPNQAADTGGISVSGPGGACQEVNGTVTIYQIAAKDGYLSQLNASFSQACGPSTAPPLVGFIRFNATQPTPIPVLPTSSWSQPGASLSS